MLKDSFDRLMSQIQLLKCLRDSYEISLNYEQILRVNYTKFLSPESVVIDVGAHIGIHFENFLNIVWPKGYVIAFEPLTHLAKELRDKFHSKKNIFEVHDVALSNFVGKSEFVYAEGTPGESGLREKPYAYPDLAKTRKIEVMVRRLDEYTRKLPRVDYIKIDIEGAEMDCLKGGIETIKRHQPIISVEYGQASYAPYGYEKKDLWEFAWSLDYTCFDIFGNILETLDEWCTACDQVYYDYYIVPNSKVDFFKSKIPGSV